MAVAENTKATEAKSAQKSRSTLTPEEAQFFKLVRLRATSAGVGQPYIAPAIFRLTPISAPGLQTMGVDKFWRVYVDFEYMMEKGVEFAAGVLAHEPWHLLRDHNKRAEAVGADKTPLVWNYAGDLEINDDIVNLIPKDSIFPGRGQFADYKPQQIAEVYYQQLMEQIKKDQPQDGGSSCPQHGDNPQGSGEQGNQNGEQQGSGEGSSQGDSNQGGDIHGQQGKPCSCGKGNPIEDKFGKANCGSGSGNDLGEYELAEGDAESVDADEHDSIKKQIAEEIKRQERSNPGSTPAHIKQWADATLEHKPVSWQQVLRGQVKSAISWKRGQTDYVRTRPARRQPIKDVIMPALRSPKPRILVGVDTSGSNLHNLGVVLQEIGAIAKQVGVRGEELMVCSIDTEVKDAKFQKFSDIKDVKFIGGGGTRMETFFETADAHANKADIFILLTDGECSWNYQPKARGKFITCIIIDEQSNYGERCVSEAEDAISSWSKVIPIRVKSE